MAKPTSRPRHAASEETATPVERELVIDALGVRGDGVASGPIYVAGALPGERVRALVSGDRGLLEEVLAVSPDRIEPQCRHAGVCGGCAFQHLAPGRQHAWKRSRILEELASFDVRTTVGPVVDAGGGGRRRAVFHGVRARAVGFVFGYAQRASHAVFDQEECPVLSEAIASARPGLRALAQMALSKPGRVDVSVTATDTGLDVLMEGAVRAPTAELVAHAVAQDWARLTVDGEALVVNRPPVVMIGGAEVRVKPGVFLQATRSGEEALAARVQAAVGDAKAVADLYAGVGTFALRLASRAPVHAVDTERSALGALAEAAKRTSGLKPITTEARDLAREPLTRQELRRYDAVVLDPPRAGAHAQARALAATPEVRKIAYVSCNPATFARDAAELTAGGFRLEEVAPVDQFVHAAHIELVGRFRR